MVCTTQNHWVYELCPSSGFLKKKSWKTNVYKKTICFRIRVSGEETLLVGCLTEYFPVISLRLSPVSTVYITVVYMTWVGQWLRLLFLSEATE
jgi:hypothetical protein